MWQKTNHANELVVSENRQCSFKSYVHEGEVCIYVVSPDQSYGETFVIPVEEFWAFRRFISATEHALRALAIHFQ